MGYSKLFDSMWSGSLYGQFEASAVFMVMLSLSDQHGNVDMSHEAIAGRTGWPIEFITEGIRQLENPDPRSRTPDADGRRIILLDDHRNWGWMITNYDKYRELERSIERREYLRQAKKKERDARRQQASTKVNTSTPHMQSSAYAEQKKETSAPPPGLDLSAWEQWQAYRKLKPASIPAAQRKLAKLGSQQAEAVEHSIASGYKGVFLPPQSSKTSDAEAAWISVRAAVRDSDLRPSIPPPLVELVSRLGGWRELGMCDPFSIEQKRKQFVSSFARR